MKKVVKLFFAVVIGMVFLINIGYSDTYASEATVSFGSNYYSKSYGEEFPVGIYVKSDMGVGIHALRLRYDTSKLQYLSGATKEANGVILLKGNGGQNSVKYWLQFKAVGGGDTNLTVDVAKAYINNNTKLINISALPNAPIHLEGGGTESNVADGGTNDVTNSATDDLMKSADNKNNVVDNINESNEEANLTSNDEIENKESDSSEEEIIESEDLGTEENDNTVNDKEEGEGNFIASVLLNLLIFVGCTALGIAIINAITNKGRKKARLQHEFEEEYREPYNPPVDNSYRGNDYMNNEHMRPLPMEGYSDREYNRQDDAIRYDPRYYNNQSQIDVEFVCNNSPIEEYGQQQQQQYQLQQQGARAHFDYIEKNLEKSLEEQIKQQMDNYY